MFSPQGNSLTRFAPFAIAIVAATVLILLSGIGARAAEPGDCGMCHEDVDVSKFDDSVHAGFDCADCHADAEAHMEGEAIPWVDCGTCHDDVTAKYSEGIHGETLGDGIDEAPKCQSCHGEPHALLPSSDEASPVHPKNLPDTCGACHSDPEFVAKFDIPRVQPIEAYEASVHAQLVAEGLPGPTCTDCHDSHGIQPGFDPRSTVSHKNVSATCGKCHEEIVTVYAESVHGVAAMKGIPEAPACTDCHGEHRIVSPSQPDSPTFASNVPKMTCERCHADLTMAAKFGLDVDKVDQYQDSYHGLATESGRITVANCGSCHGVHDVLPSSDPRSHTHASNLPETCGQCHPGAGKTFAIGEIHVDEHDRANPGVYWVRVIYVWLIFGTIGFMIVHNGLDLFRKARSGVPRAPEGVDPGEGVRMVPGFRIAHLLMLISFAILVYSGFALKYPDAWWARPFEIWSSATFDLRGWVHRVGAVVMLVSVAVHFVHLAIDRESRKCFVRGMIPTLADVREFMERMRWYVGLRKDPPHTPRLGYPEKMEYLALMWGIVVMSVTGFLLWFENWTLAYLPGGADDIATAIHWYEAILASLAIVVWHFYFVLLDPVVYPMDTAWITGRAHRNRQAERMGVAVAETPGRLAVAPPDPAAKRPAAS